ncbi:MAG: DUF6232 family protein [Gammaproteobacteria bacterium]
MAEQSFLDEGGVSITNSRFMVAGQTYAMSGITSVKAVTHNPSRKGPIILVAIGLVAMLAGKEAIIGGLLFLAAGVAWWVLQKPKYVVVLHSASGEAEALTSKDGGFISKVVNALNQAIVARG